MNFAVGKNYHFEAYFFRWFGFSQVFSVDLEIRLKKKGDHTPSLFFLFVVLGVALLEIDFYFIHHREEEKVKPITVDIGKLYSDRKDWESFW